MCSALAENDIRLYVYRYFVSECRAPTIHKVAGAFDAAPEQVLGIFESLERGHVFVLDPDTREIRMAMPFSALPTTYRVSVGESSWWAN